MTKKLSPTEKRSRKPIQRACVFCHKKHLQCSNERPCKNCIKRNVADQCRDVVRKRAKYLSTNLKADEGTSENVMQEGSRNESFTSRDTATKRLDDLNLNIEIGSTKMEEDNGTGIPGTGIEGMPANSKSEAFFQKVDSREGKLNDNKSTEKDNTMHNTTNDVLNKLLDNYNVNMASVNISESLSQDDNIADDKIHHAFNSNYLNQEYLMLGDIILKSRPTSPSPSNTSASDYYDVFANTSLNAAELNTFRSRDNRLKDSRPFIALGFSNQPHELDKLESNTDLSNLDASIENSIPSIESAQILGKTPEYKSPFAEQPIYKAILDIYLEPVENFNYPNSYHSLTNFLKNRFSGGGLTEEKKQKKRDNLLIILKLIASYRPTFISAHKNLLRPNDLLFLEMSFQRSLIDCKTLSQLNSSPTVIWRRTGEIVFISDELLSILGLNAKQLLSKKTFIMELMYDDESIINYFRRFKSIAVGNLHSSIVTKCKLSRYFTKGGSTDLGLSGLKNDDYVEFSSVWTVKRDLFDLPMLIVGQFLPILLSGEGVRKY